MIDIRLEGVEREVVRTRDKLDALDDQNRTTHEMLSRQIEALERRCHFLAGQITAVDRDLEARIRRLENDL